MSSWFIGPRVAGVELCQGGGHDTECECSEGDSATPWMSGAFLLALFDGAERAARSAILLRSKVDGLGLEVRQAIHSGEVEVSVGDVRGIAVHAAARILTLAQPSEILISGTVHDLLDGSSFTFDDRGRHELKGLSGERAVFAITDVN